MATSTVENYLKQLYLEQRGTGGGLVAMGKLAAAMGVVPGTATSMIRALSDSGLVNYEPRGGVGLTPRGEQLALHVLRRHRILELFLVKTLGLDWSVVHEEADSLEHAVSDRVLERIDALLGHPTSDPHGDPIPNSSGVIHEPQLSSLVNCAKCASYRIARVLDQQSEFLRFANRQGLVPGANVRVEKAEPAAQAIRVRADGHEEVSLGLSAAEKILVEPVEPCSAD